MTTRDKDRGSGDVKPVLGIFGTGLLSAAGTAVLLTGLGSLISEPRRIAEEALADARSAIVIGEQHGEQLNQIREEDAALEQRISGIRSEINTLHEVINRFREQLAKGERWTAEQQREFGKRIDGDVGALTERVKELERVCKRE